MRLMIWFLGKGLPVYKARYLTGKVGFGGNTDARGGLRAHKNCV